MALNRFGEIVRRIWFELPRHYPHVELSTFSIMPNHVHGIIIFFMDIQSVGAGLLNLPDQIANNASDISKGTRVTQRPAPTYVIKRHPFSEIICAFKSYSARRINALCGVKGVHVWQRNYYEHIIRNEYEFQAISDYILDNPNHWELDEQYP